MNSPTLVPFDCADLEINSQLASSLEVLRRNVDEMVDRSTRKMAQFEDRLHSYGRRFEVLKKKLEVLKTTDTQPLITSPAEFPGKIHVGRSLVFRKLAERESSSNIQPKATTMIDHMDKQKPIKDMILRKNGYRFVFPKGKHTEALQFRDGERDQPILLSNFDQKRRGFVRPERIYEFADGLSDDSHKKSVEVDGQSENGESLLIFESLAAQEAADPFTYKPGTGNLTDFDLPEDLPQLTGIAKNIFTNRESLFGFDNTATDDDEIFSGSSQRHGTSDFTGNNMFYVFEKNIDQRSLNSRVSFTPTPGPSMFSNTRPTDSLLLDAPSSSTSSEKESATLVAPLVSPPVQIQQPIAAPRPSVAVSSISSAPPAPPPPPIQLLSSIPSPPMPTGRSDLMEAIRAAGGASKAKLKKVTQKEDDEETEVVSVRPSASDGGEDLMASLTKALQKRRKVIAGGNSARKFDALEQKRKPTENSTFSTLREIIPPPSHCPDSDDGGNEEDWK